MRILYLYCGALVMSESDSRKCNQGVVEQNGV